MLQGTELLAVIDQPIERDNHWLKSKFDGSNATTGYKRPQDLNNVLRTFRGWKPEQVYEYFDYDKYDPTFYQ